ncbi:MAG: hypothetical protein J6Z09_01110, partial [Lachnospiraceae bacterium]|nr:hypothetical protein [Lachnospiraceae bacterium]
MKKISGYLLSMFLVFVALAVANISVLAFISLKAKGIKDILSAKEISARISLSDGEYNLPEETKALLDNYSSFAMILNNEGEVVWAYAMPDELPKSYNLGDVAQFSRWYLMDYPVYTQIRNEGLLVLGLPRNSTWKYRFDFSMTTLKGLIGALPYIILINIALLILLPILITRHWLKSREKSRTEWIAGVSHDIRTPLSIVMGSVEKGSAAERQCFRIRDLIGNLNTENKLDSGTGKWNKESIALAPLLREILCDYINTYEEAYTFNPEIDESLEDFKINADSALIRRMIDNLINNSILHNESGCEINVTLERAPGTKPSSPSLTMVPEQMR